LQIVDAHPADDPAAAHALPDALIGSDPGIAELRDLLTMENLGQGLALAVWLGAQGKRADIARDDGYSAGARRRVRA
jgi:hypothetical protein